MVLRTCHRISRIPRVSLGPFIRPRYYTAFSQLFWLGSSLGALPVCFSIGSQFYDDQCSTECAVAPNISAKPAHFERRPRSPRPCWRCCQEDRHGRRPFRQLPRPFMFSRRVYGQPASRQDRVLEFAKTTVAAAGCFRSFQRYVCRSHIVSHGKLIQIVHVRCKSNGNPLPTLSHSVAMPWRT